MSEVPLHRYFRSGIDANEFARICERTGVREIAVSLISGRCGSTLLSHMVAKLRFGRGQEPFNEWEESRLKRLAEREAFGEFLIRILRSDSIDGRLYFQITPFRLASLGALLPREDLPFPRVRHWSFIFRRNIVAQALSYFNAASSGMWHSTQERAPAGPAMEFQPEAVLKWICHIHGMERRAWEMARAFQPGLYFYEDIVSAPVETLHRFLAEHGHEAGAEDIAQAALDPASPRKIVRDGYALQYCSVLEAYPWLNEILAERAAGAIPSPTLDRRLAQL